MSFIAAVLILLATKTSTPSPVPAGYQCEDFQSYPFPQTFAGPFATIGRFDFRNAFSNGAVTPLQLVDRVEDKDGRPELSVGFSSKASGNLPLTIGLPTRNFPSVPADILVEFQHFAHMTVSTVGGNSGTLPARTRAFVNLKGTRVIQFDGSETLLYRICWR